MTNKYYKLYTEVDNTFLDYNECTNGWYW